MKKRRLLLTCLAVVVAFSAVDGLVSLIGRDVALGQPLDLDTIDHVRIEGGASRLILTTQSGQPYDASLTGHREGWGAMWYSGWYGDDCTGRGRMHREGDTLVVETDPAFASRFFDWSDCTVTLRANLKPETAVTIRQQASKMTLNGDFSAVDVTADAGDFSLRGHADTLDLSGAALRVRAFYESVRQNETLMLTGSMMDIGLHFLTPTPVSVLTEATASYIDNTLGNTAGARPQITIKGQMVRARID
ncbi:hypothetical protein NAC44_05905 [Allorhizobium sp. BGMRC 0089]|uniref:hypothetical protein n=1 Tax=Allorhizobium sonneratiae TaxID=2934936 RepID=UPI0020347F3F|nr:hypothetical protein [Allorhizobium sonneratiae]MCM2291860.1 hypothetical protein [Allorhizobium sonneratiae]